MSVNPLANIYQPTTASYSLNIALPCTFNTICWLNFPPHPVYILQPLSVSVYTRCYAALKSDMHLKDETKKKTSHIQYNVHLNYLIQRPL